MSFTAYLREGVSVANNFHNRFNSTYQQDQAIAIHASHQYKGTVTHSEQKAQVSKRVLDQAVEVLTVTDDIRNPQLQFWTQRSVQSLRVGVSGLVVATSGVAGVAAAKTCLVGTAAVAGPVAAGAVVILGIALAILGFYRKSQANEQFEAWKDPLATYQAQRQRSGTLGFSYVFSHHLKNTIVHPEECRQLWNEWSDYLMPLYQDIQVGKANSAETVKRVKDFFESNPLDADAMEYAFANLAPAPQNIQDLAKFYQEMKLAYSDVRARAQIERNKIAQEEKKLLQRNEANRDAWLAPAKAVRDLMKQDALQKKENDVKALKVQLNQNLQSIKDQCIVKKLNSQTRDELIAAAQQAYNNHPIVIKANQEYEAKCRKYQLLYEVASAPINLTFDNKKRDINDWAQRQTQKVNKQENKQISYFVQDVQGVAKAYVNTTAYNRAQAVKDPQDLLYPQLDGLYIDLNTAYTIPPAYDPALQASDVNQFYQQIYVQQVPSAPPMDD